MPALTADGSAFKKTVFRSDLSAFWPDKDPDKNPVLLKTFCGLKWVGRHLTNASNPSWWHAVWTSHSPPSSHRRFPLMSNCWIFKTAYSIFIWVVFICEVCVPFTALNRIIWLFTGQTWLCLSLDKLSNYLPSTSDKLHPIPIWVCSRWQLNSHLTFCPNGATNINEI